MAREQAQFLEVVDRDRAEALWVAAVRPERLPGETIPLREALGRVLAEDVASRVDVPPFDRSNVDGYALVAESTFGAAEETPRRLTLIDEEIAAGRVPRESVVFGSAIPISTGGMLPRGADGVVMIEHTRLVSGAVEILRPIAPGANIGFAGTDLVRGECVARAGTRLTSRETGMLAAVGCGEVSVVRRPRVFVFSTGDELVEPGESLGPARIHDANATLLADAVIEAGGVVHRGGIIPDDETTLTRMLDEARRTADLVILSGGTSKGAGDLSFRILERAEPGIVVHGVALKPGKPVCLGAIGRVPVAVLPGFPTSAIFTFHEFVAPMVRRLAGIADCSRESVTARLAVRCNSERGRTEYLLVGLIEGDRGLSAYPMGKGSGSVSTFSRADGFLIIGKDQEYADVDEIVDVTLLGAGLGRSDLVVIGSHCVGLEAILGRLQRSGLATKSIWVGSQGGLDSVARGGCDLAGIHLLDPATNRYNETLLPAGVRLLEGYGRVQGLIFRRDDPRFQGAEAPADLVRSIASPGCRMVNRNRGSGTRILIDRLLGESRPEGHPVEVRSHNAVAAAVSQGRADWGVAIETVAKSYGLGFVRLELERYDFAVGESRWDRPAVRRFRECLADSEMRRELAGLGFDLNGRSQ
ncbi:MAG: molybdopterin biosynthesis protein [Isosphaeraceae bacterium]|nr:molybdopterin biosynthesis protein [Isosphaeraceae bacterium]